MEFKNLQKLFHLYQSDPQFRMSLQDNPVEALLLWRVADDEPGAQALVRNNKWLSYSPQTLCALMAQGEPLDWAGPIPLPPLPNMAQ